MKRVVQQKLAEITNIFQFEQLMKEPTRVTPITKTLIDVVFTNRPELINVSSVIDLGISYQNDKSKTDLFTYLPDQTFSNLSRNPNYISDKWKTIFTLVADKHAHKITKRVGVDSPHGLRII